MWAFATSGCSAPALLTAVADVIMDKQGFPQQFKPQELSNTVGAAKRTFSHMAYGAPGAGGARRFA